MGFVALEIELLVSVEKSSLMNAIFFCNGKILCLRGDEEHQSLKPLQFQFGKDEGGEHVVFIENGSKNCSGSYEEKLTTKW